MKTIKARALNLFALFLAILIAISVNCSNDNTWSNPDNENDNQPSAPYMLFGYALSDSIIYLNWYCTGLNVTQFLIYRSQTDIFTLIDSSGSSRRSYADHSLEESSAYSYFVRSTNGVELSGTTDTITIMTLSSNSPPAMPDNPVPADSAVNQPIALELTWTCYDPNDGDTLTYNFYLDSAVDTIPPVIVLGLTESNYDIENLLYDMLYEWQVVACDNHGDSTAGSVWTFSTGTAP